MATINGYQNFGKLKDNYLKGMRLMPEVFDLEFLKWSVNHPHISEDIRQAIKLRIIELEKSN